jgi:altronate hydrolase
MVALADLPAGEIVTLRGESQGSSESWTLSDPIPAKHKFACVDFAPGDAIYMYGVIVARARLPIPRATLLSTANVIHDAADFSRREVQSHWNAPDASPWLGKTFDGFHRPDGQVGTRNYWLVIPLVFCENRNVDALREAFEEELGYARPKQYRAQVHSLVAILRSSGSPSSSLMDEPAQSRVFPNIDGIRFLVHQMGCGGTRDDARALCGLLAGYIHHPNVAGATVLSLGCQNAQPSLLIEELAARDHFLAKPVLIFSQQEIGLESEMMGRAISATFAQLTEANKAERKPAPLSKLVVGLKCGGSDGFSGLSANPAIGHLSDILTTIGGRTILSEFPELCGSEQSLIDRCASDEDANRFMELMRTYNARAKAVNSGFEMNPSPGNIRDGLLTDAMKSAGAARKGGTAPVADVLDYPEYVRKDGLTLLCTPGNDVECVTAQVGSGANLVLFTTGLGTPTGNPIAPVVKLATNTVLAEKMPDIIDIDTGAVIRGESTVEQMGELILDRILDIASGRVLTKAEQLRQDDFIPWKRGVSL